MRFQNLQHSHHQGRAPAFLHMCTFWRVQKHGVLRFVFRDAVDVQSYAANLPIVVFERHKLEIFEDGEIIGARSQVYMVFLRCRTTGG
jgi:hypothetical protein